MYIKSIFHIFLFDDVLKQIKRDAKSVFEKDCELSLSWEYFRDLNTKLSRNKTRETSS